ncbi:hypothetical protein ASF72_01520 [Arthrobacter sp. Leaf141]|nr:hypothetical protein ASF72_01520 [Arthrobacter sp. Leaf141]
MMARQNPRPFEVSPTSWQIKIAFWFGLVASIAFWFLFVVIVFDRGFADSLLALPVPILATWGTLSAYFKYKRLLDARKST